MIHGPAFGKAVDVEGEERNIVPLIFDPDGGESSVFVDDPRATMVHVDLRGCTNSYGNFFHDQPAGVVTGDAYSQDPNLAGQCVLRWLNMNVKR